MNHQSDVDMETGRLPVEAERTDDEFRNAVFAAESVNMNKVGDIPRERREPVTSRKGVPEEVDMVDVEVISQAGNDGYVDADGRLVVEHVVWIHGEHIGEMGRSEMAEEDYVDTDGCGDGLRVESSSHFRVSQ